VAFHVADGCFLDPCSTYMLHRAANSLVIMVCVKSNYTVCSTTVLNVKKMVIRVLTAIVFAIMSSANVLSHIEHSLWTEL
jgi:hypothetical protein